MVKVILSFRYVVWLIVPVVLLNGLAFTVLGIIKAGKGYLMILHGQLEHGQRPGILLAESLEGFLIAFVMFVFALGLLQLFLLENEKKSLVNIIPEWLKVNNFMDLKLVLWESILTSILIFIVSDITQYEDDITWKILILPGVLLIITISFFLLKKVQH